MYYVSTRNKEYRRTAAQAIAQGLSPDGGLMLPEVFPKLSHNALESMKEMSYQQRAVYVMSAYLDDFYIARRGFAEGQTLAEYPEENQALYEVLTAGAAAQ